MLMIFFFYLFLLLFYVENMFKHHLIQINSHSGKTSFYVSSYLFNFLKHCYCYCFTFLLLFNCYYSWNIYHHFTSSGYIALLIFFTFDNQLYFASTDVLSIVFPLLPLVLICWCLPDLSHGQSCTHTHLFIHFIYFT